MTSATEASPQALKKHGFSIGSGGRPFFVKSVVTLSEHATARHWGNNGIDS